MAISVVQSVLAYSSARAGRRTLTFAFSSSVTVGSTILIALASRYPIQTVSDSKGNVWIKDREYSRYIFNVQIWRTTVTAGGTDLIVTATSPRSVDAFGTAMEMNQELQFYRSYFDDNTLSLTVGAGPFQIDRVPSIILTGIAVSSSSPIMTRPAEWERMAYLSFGTGIGLPALQGETSYRIYSSISTDLSQWTQKLRLYDCSGACQYIEMPDDPPDPPDPDPDPPPPPPPPPPPDPGPPPYVPGPPVWTEVPGWEQLGPPQFAPWFAPYPEPGRAPEEGEFEEPAADPPELPFLIPPLPDPLDRPRLEASLRELVTLLNSLSRQLFLFRDSNSEQWKVRGGGMSQSRDPTTADDSSIGARVSTPWINTGTTPPRVFVCWDNTLGAAQWVRLLTEADGDASGLTGSI